MKIKKDVTQLPPVSVAVVVNFSAGFLGGPLSRLLKCLTAVKVCEEYEKSGVTAVPVCYVHRDASSGFFQGEINLVDRRSKLHCVKSIGEIETLFPDGDREVLSALKEAFASDTNPVSSCAHWLRYLLKDYGVSVVECNDFAPDQNSCTSKPGEALERCWSQSRSLPVAAVIIDSTENTYINEISPLEHEGLPRPIVRALPNVTISSARNMKTLRRYGLDFERLFDGKERVMDYVRVTLKSDVPDRLQKLQDETGAVLDEFATATFSTRDGRSGRICKSRAARIIYQLEKIQRHSHTALTDKEKAAENRICKACDFLAPHGRRQQDVLGGVQIPLSYGMAGLHTLYESLDITTTNPQLLEMD